MSLELPLGLQFLPPQGAMKGGPESLARRPDLFFPYNPASNPLFHNGAHNPAKVKKNIIQPYPFKLIDVG